MYANLRITNGIGERLDEDAYFAWKVEIPAGATVRVHEDRNDGGSRPEPGDVREVEGPLTITADF